MKNKYLNHYFSFGVYVTVFAYCIAKYCIIPGTFEYLWKNLLFLFGASISGCVSVSNLISGIFEHWKQLKEKDDEENSQKSSEKQLLKG